MHVHVQLIFQMKKQHRIWWMWCTSTISQYNNHIHVEFVMTYLCMHAEYKIYKIKWLGLNIMNCHSLWCLLQQPTANLSFNREMTHLLNSNNQIKITYLKQDLSNWAAPQCRQSDSRLTPSEMAYQKQLTEIWDFPVVLPKWMLRLTDSNVDEA